LLDIVIICYIVTPKIAGIKGSTIWVNTHFHKTGWYGCLNLILTEPFWSWWGHCCHGRGAANILPLTFSHGRCRQATQVLRSVREWGMQYRLAIFIWKWMLKMSVNHRFLEVFYGIPMYTPLWGKISDCSVAEILCGKDSTHSVRWLHAPPVTRADKSPTRYGSSNVGLELEVSKDLCSENAWPPSPTVPYILQHLFGLECW
jgi:hypothetical protein